MRGSAWTTADDGTPIPRAVGADEAARLLGVTVKRVYTMCRRGELRGAIHFASMWWIPVEAVARQHRLRLGRALTPADVRAVVGEP